MTRREFLRRAAAGAVAGPMLLRGASRSESDLLAEAEERIRQHRRRRRVLLIRDAKGRPVPGAKVRVQQTRHEYWFGCNLFLFGRGSGASWESEYRARFIELFNFATLGFYWAMYEPQPGRPQEERTDQILEWAAKHGIVCKGHPLVWDDRVSSPSWLPESDEELARLVETRVRSVVSRFRGRLDVWDVVNEATHLPDRVSRTRMARWGEAIGPVAYTRRPLEVARAVHPEAVLLVNDYRLDQAYYNLLDAVRDAEGRPLYDAIGLQSHMHGGPWPLARIWEVCDRFAQLGRPLHFTEITVVSSSQRSPGEPWGPTNPEAEARQAEYITKFYTMVFAHPATQALVWWDLSDRGAWQGAAAGLLRRDMSPKPAYERLHELIRRRWWTQAEGIVGTDGEYVVEAFHGRHRITVEAQSGRTVTLEVDWPVQAPDRMEVRLQ
ncbi:MAG: endo-1,4-beta-xylanase [Verrucomicrobiota bacterium]|nr:endo-1,4-beta-xylanase [Limisphaera sp.]MDW8381265.1 endo-1,4-beta-xylanase [Verrucomicrobiota bacterium]